MTWEHNGIKSDGEAPSIVGQYDEVEPGGCIVLGTSRKAWVDFSEATELFEKDSHYDVIAVNDIAHQIRKRITHICSLHKELVGPLRKLRNVKMLEHVHTHSIDSYSGVDFAWGSMATGSGTSGLFGVKIAMAMGYKKIIVCGIGMDGTGHYYDPEDHAWNGSAIYESAHRIQWNEFHRDSQLVKDRVRVMSGKMVDLYDRPSREWVYENAKVGV